MKILYATRNEKNLHLLKEIAKDRVDIDSIDTLLDLDLIYEPKKKTDNLEANLKEILKYYQKKYKDEYDYYLIEDFGFYLEAAPNLIGADRKTWWLGNDRDRNEAIIRLFEGVKDRRAYYIQNFVLINKKGELISKSVKLDGFVGRRIKEKNGSGYDSIFVLENGKYLSSYEEEALKNFDNLRTGLNLIIEIITKEQNDK